MPNLLSAVALLCFVGATTSADAQTAPTIFGVVDAGIANYRTTARDAVSGSRTRQSRWEQQKSGLGASRLGFRGAEDLGDGLVAGFWFEAQIGNDTGSPGLERFSRRATVSLSGRLGELRLGRDFTPTFWNDALFDPFATSGAGSSLISQVSDAPFLANTRSFQANNSVAYFLPPGLGGFYGQAMYSLRDGVDTAPASGGAPGSGTGPYRGLRLGYAQGPWNIGFSYGRSTLRDTATLRYRLQAASIGASYEGQTFKLFAELSRLQAQFDFPDRDLPRYRNSYPGFLLGVSVPVSAGLLRLSYSAVRYRESVKSSAGNAPSVSKLAFGYVHQLSKRTALYSTYARVRNKNDPLYVGGLGNAAITPAGSLGFSQSDARLLPGTAAAFEVGVHHSF